MLRSPPMACRRVTTTICAVLLTTGLILHSNVGTTAESPEPINIVVTIPVLKDLAEQVGGQHVRVTSLLKGFENEHTYSPKPSDLVAVRKAQLLFEVGIGLEVWVSSLVKNAGSSSLMIVTTSKGIALMHDDHAHDGDSLVGEKHGQRAVVLWREVLHEHHHETGVVRQRAQQLGERLQAAGRRADADDGERTIGLRELWRLVRSAGAGRNARRLVRARRLRGPLRGSLRT